MLARIFVLMILVVFVGCSPDYVKPGVFVEVHGKVFLDGRPVRDAKIFFVPEDLGIQKEFAMSIGSTGPLGEFELQTADGREGALVGNHRVYISKIVEDGEDVKPEADKGAAVEVQPIDDEGFDEAKHREHIWDLIDNSVQQPRGEKIPFYYNLKSELSCKVIPGRGIQRVTFELSSVDPMLGGSD